MPVNTKNFFFYFPPTQRKKKKVHVDVDYWGEDRVGPEPTLIPARTQVLAFASVILGSFALYYFLEDKRMYRPVVPKQYPGNSKVHYTFETK